jgi:hypothetical protein
MPLVNDPAEPPVLPPEPGIIEANITGPQYRHAIVDAKVTPFASLLTHIAGSSLTVDYYSQIVQSDEDLSPYQPTLMPPYQQYLLCRGMEIKLQGDLSQTPDAESTEWSVTGAAIIYPFLKPNIGDGFIMDIGDGRAGFMTIIAVTRKTILQQACFEVNFELSFFVDQPFMVAITRKVVKETTYVKDFLTYGQNPVLVDDDLSHVTRIQNYEKTLLNRFLTEFFSREYRTLMVPGQTSSTYDPFVVATILTMFEREAHPIIPRIRQLNVDGLRVVDEFQIWNAMLRLDNTLGQVMAQKAYLVARTAFSSYPTMDGIFYSGVQRIVVPNVAMNNVDQDYGNQQALTGVDYHDLGDFDWDLASVFINNAPGGFVVPGDDPLAPSYVIGEVPYIHPTVLDEYYVFSRLFYENANGQSKLEILVRQMLAGETFSRVDLFALCDDVQRWGRLDRFYYVPVLIILLKVALRKI